MRGKRSLRVFSSVKDMFVKQDTQGIIGNIAKNVVPYQSSGNEEKFIDIQRTDSDQHNVSSSKKAKIKGTKRLSENKELSLEKKEDCYEYQYQQEDEVKALKALQEQLSKRHELEQQIIKLVSGNTGMVQLLDNLLIQAKNKNQDYFLFYAASFQKKAQELSDCLHHYYQKPMDYVSFKHSALKKEKEDLERLIALPAKNEKLFIKLLKADQELRKYISKDASFISVDAMDSWRNAVLLLDKDQDAFCE